MANELDCKVTHWSVLKTLLVGCGKLWSRGRGSVVENMSCAGTQGLKLQYYGLEKVELRHLEKELVAEKVQLGGR